MSSARQHRPWSAPWTTVSTMTVDQGPGRRCDTARVTANFAAAGADCPSVNIRLEDVISSQLALICHVLQLVLT